MDEIAVRDIIRAQMTVDTNPLLTAFLFGITALCFVNAWPALTTRPPLHHLKKEERWRHWRWFHLPSMRAVESLQWFANAFLAVAAVYYLYVTRDPVGAHDANYYFSIEILFFVFCFTKTFWQHFLFSHYRHNVGLALSIVAAAVNIGICLALVIVLGVRAAYLSMGFMIGALIYYVFTLAWSGHIAQHHWREDYF